MKKPIYIISDNHFLLEKNVIEEKRRQKLFKLFSKIKKSGGTLILGGDFFDFWVQSYYSIPNFYDDILDEISMLTKNKIEIHLVAGNHDYWDFGFLSKKYGLFFHKKDFEFFIDKKKILITHGDGILKDDKGYRLMKRIIRSPLFILIIRLIPSSVMSYLAKFISNSKSKFGKTEILDDKYKTELKIYAKKMIELHGYHTVLMGHYHQKGIYEINNSYFIHLGDWINNFTVTTFTKENKWIQV
tara:strand:- start:17344 stop:18072 length:729 start_codon:yes stop_codon:yes gene_type:complete